MIAENPKQLEQYRGGKTKLQGFFAGQVWLKSIPLRTDLCFYQQREKESGNLVFLFFFVMVLMAGDEGVERKGESSSVEQDPFREIERKEQLREALSSVF